MPAISIRTTKPTSRKIHRVGKGHGKVPNSQFSKNPVEPVFHHPAAFGEAARKYAGIVRSGVGDLSTREGFDD